MCCLLPDLVCFPNSGLLPEFWFASRILIQWDSHNLWYTGSMRKRAFCFKFGTELEDTKTNSLKVSYEEFREKAKLLAQEISRDLPCFIVHDISHIDALWGMADKIVGPNFLINSAETYVLGGSFLLHDLGMGLAAYPSGIEELKRHKLWKDVFVAKYKDKFGRFPTNEEILCASEDIEQSTNEIVLRELPAEKAEDGSSYGQDNRYL